MEVLASKKDFEKIVGDDLIIARIENLDTKGALFVSVKYVWNKICFIKNFKFEMEKEVDLEVMAGYGDDLYFVHRGSKGEPYFTSDELNKEVEEAIRGYLDYDMVISYMEVSDDKENIG